MPRLATVALIAAIAIAACGDGDGGGYGGGGETAATDYKADREAAIAAAEEAYAAVKGQDLESGPCIAEEVPDLPDWVVDIVHDPRQPVDEQYINQCERYRSAEAKHYVELTPEGELIRAK
jgi:hypothetical protein